MISIIEFRHCLLGTGCDMFQIDTSSAPQLKCTFFANTPMKTMVNLYKYIRYRPQSLSDVQIYILHCSIPQENVVKNSDFFTQTHLRKFSLKIWFLSYHFIFVICFRSRLYCPKKSSRNIFVIFAIKARFLFVRMWFIAYFSFKNQNKILNFLNNNISSGIN